MPDFQWPWEYTFPPFFTLQLHEETRHRQINIWAELFLKYLKHTNKFTINVNESSIPLFYNEKINRRLKSASILEILQYLQSTGHAEPLDKKRTEWQVYWYTLEEYGNMVYDWVQETGQTNTMCTFYEIVAGESTENLPFHGVDETVLLNALRLLEQKGKCEIIQLDDSYGVKFF